MSATSKDFVNGIGCYVVAKGSVSGDTTKIYFIWEASKGSETGSYVWSGWNNSKSCPIKVKIDGSQLNLSWTKNKTDKTSTGVMMVTKATSSTFTVSKPFFTLSFYDGKQTYEDTFSMYDIENAPTTVSADEITIDGSASSIAEFSNYLGTKSVDGSLKVTWSLGNHSYSKTVKNVYSTSYVIPVSWLDAISDSSQAYGGGKVTVQISYGTKVYTTISATFNCIVSDTFLPTISSVTLADKTNTPVPATVIETVKPTEGTGGTELTTLNSGQRMCYGSNNYKESAVREWLNSDKVAGSVWTPATNYDRPPSWVSNKAGFMNGMDADFLAVIGKTTKVTCRNNVTDGGGSDTTKDKFFLLSRRELFMGDEVSSVKEGEPYPYYSNYSDYTSPNTGADSNRVKYKNGSPQWQWERTPYAGHSNNVRGVNYAGNLSNNYANYSDGVAPACNVI